MNRRSILKLAGAAALSTTLPAANVRAQAYPSGPITLVVAWPAGGGSDISMRLLADSLTRIRRDAGDLEARGLAQHGCRADVVHGACGRSSDIRPVRHRNRSRHWHSR